MIRITTIGVPDIRSGNTRIRPDAEVLFGLALYLGLNAGSPIPRETLLRIFWPGVADADARHALRQLLYRLRKGALPIDVDGAVLVIDREAVVTDLDPILTADDPTTLTREQMVGLDRVLASYTPRISPEFAEWVDTVRTQVEGRYRRALMSLIASARREGRWSDLEHWSQKCLRIDPLNEEATLARAEASAMVGAKAEAMSILDEFVAELGERTPTIGLPAQMLRNRISDLIGQEASSSTMPLIGRASEVATLTQSIEGVARGASAVVRIHGIGGVGKSRLASETVSIARLRGFSVASVRLAASDGARPMSLMMDLAARLVGLPGALGCSPEALNTVRRLCEKSAGKVEDGTPASMQVVREQTRRALIELLEALTDERPLLVWVDNADYADKTSQALIAELVSGLREQPVLWLLCATRLDHCSYIQDEPTGSVLMKLSGLSLEETTQLAQLVKPCVGKPEEAEARGLWLQHATGGIPLFVRELASHEWKSPQESETPPSLREVVRRRLARLSASAIRTLRACTMMGAHASIGALIEVLECEASALHEILEELDQEGLVSNDAASPLWVHEIIGQEVLEQSSPALIRLLHFQVGTAIAKRATTSWSPRLAWDAAAHLASAGETAQAVSLLAQTANHQMAIGMPAAAATTFRRAHEITQNKQEASSLFVAELHALSSAGDWHQVRLRSSETISNSLVSEGSEAREDLELLNIRARWYEGGNYKSTFDRAVAFARRRQADPIKRAKAVALACMIGDNLRVKDLIEDVSPLVLEIEKACAGCSTSVLESKAILAHAAGDSAASLEYLFEIAEEYLRNGSTEGRARTLMNCSIPLLALGRTEEAARTTEESFKIAKNFRLTAIASRCADRQSGLLFELGDLVASAEWAATAMHWNDRQSDATMHKSIRGQRFRVFVHSRLCGINDETLEGYFAPLLEEPLVRVRHHDLAVLLYWRLCREECDQANTLLTTLVDSLFEAGGPADSDYVRSAVEFALASGLALSTERNERVRQILSHRGVAPRAPWYLIAARERNREILFRNLEASDAPAT